MRPHGDRHWQALELGGVLSYSCWCSHEFPTRFSIGVVPPMHESTGRRRFFHRVTALEFPPPWFTGTSLPDWILLEQSREKEVSERPLALPLEGWRGPQSSFEL